MCSLCTCATRHILKVWFILSSGSVLSFRVCACFVFHMLCVLILMSRYSLKRQQYILNVYTYVNVYIRQPVSSASLRIHLRSYVCVTFLLPKWIFIFIKICSRNFLFKVVAVAFIWSPPVKFDRFVKLGNMLSVVYTMIDVRHTCVPYFMYHSVNTVLHNALQPTIVVSLLSCSSKST